MTTYHLKSWSKTSGSVSIDRIYINADDRSSLGFIERRTVEAARGCGSYYDAHRMAKGDDTVVVSDEVILGVDREIAEKIVAAAVAHNAKYAFLAETDGMGKFLGLKEFTRGIDWFGPRGKSLKKLAASFTVEI